MNQILFPAHAGVFPGNETHQTPGLSLPRARGGISTVPEPLRLTISSSPRTRGYFYKYRLKRLRETLFPAHAGVFPVSQTC